MTTDETVDQTARQISDETAYSITDGRLQEVIAEQEEIFVRRQPGSQRLAGQARQHLAGGVTSS